MAGRAKQLQRAQLQADAGCIFTPTAVAEELDALQGAGAHAACE